MIKFVFLATFGLLFLIFRNDLYRHGSTILIGSCTMALIVTLIKERKCDSVWISVFSPNTSALSCYKKFGFIEREVGMLKMI